MEHILSTTARVSLQRVLDSVLDVVCVFNTQGQFVYVTQASFALLGYHPHELIGRPFSEFIVQKDLDKTLNSAIRLIGGEQTTNFENNYYHKDGHMVHLVWSGRWDPVDQLFYYVARDASTKVENRLLQNRFEQEVKRHHAEKHDMLERITDGFFTMDENWRITFANSQVEKILPLKKEDYLARSYWECFPDMVGSVYYEQYLKVMQEKVPAHFEAFFPPFQKLLEVNAYPSDNGLTVFFRDVTEKRKIEEELRNLSLIAKETVNGVMITKPNGRITWINDAFTRITGFTNDEAVGKTPGELLDGPDTDPETVRYYYEQLEKGVAFEIEILNYSKWGEAMWTHVVGQPLYNAAGGLEQYFFIGTDITSRRKAEEEVNKLSRIVKENNHLICTTDQEGSITWINDAFVRETGFTVEEAVGKKLSQLLNGPETDPATAQYIAEQLKVGKSFHVEILRYTKSRKKLWLDVYYQAVPDNRGRTYRFFVLQIDITERKQLKECLDKELRQRQQMITTAAITAQENERALVSKELHDNVNQVLTTVKLYLELCINGIDNSKELLNNSMLLVQQSIEEIRCLSKRLSAPTLGNIRLVDSIKELTAAIGATDKVIISLHLPVGEDLDVEQGLHLAVYRILQEHLTNILKHAEARNVAVALQFDQHHLVLKVTDDGKGFDPAQQGKGIGITNMRSRAESLNGTLAINSIPGCGTELLVQLPLVG